MWYFECGTLECGTLSLVLSSVVEYVIFWNQESGFEGVVLKFIVIVTIARVNDFHDVILNVLGVYFVVS